MKIYIFFFLTGSIFQLFACDENLSRFPVECQLQDRFQIVREKFKNDFNVEAEDILEYKAPRFIDRYSWEKAKKSESLNPRSIYKPAPDTWDLWSKTEIATRDMNEDVTTIEDLEHFHQMAMTKKIMTKWSLLKGARPGKIRSKHTQYPPAYNFNCKDNKASLAQVEVYRHFDVLDESGKPMLKVNFKECKDSPGSYWGFIRYLKSYKVPKELNRWLEAYNDKNFQNLSPIERVADLQRWFISIHPFGDGNGRTSRLLQDLFLKKWNLPAAASADLQKDLETPKALYREQMKNALETSVQSLEKCLIEYEKTHGDLTVISPWCHVENRN